MYAGRAFNRAVGTAVLVLADAVAAGRTISAAIDVGWTVAAARTAKVLRASLFARKTAIPPFAHTSSHNSARAVAGTRFGSVSRTLECA